MPLPSVPTTDPADTLVVAATGSTSSKSLADWMAGFDNIVGKWSIASTTNSTASTTLATVTVPPGAMGANGQMSIEALWTYSSSANNKTVFCTVNGTVVDSVIATTTTRYREWVTIANRGNVTSQIVAAATENTAGSGGFSSQGINTASALTVVFAAVCATSVDSITLEYYNIRTVRGT